MSRAAGLCRRCGGVKRGRAARTASPVAQCSRCGDPVCDRHVTWINDGWVCSKCARQDDRRASLPAPGMGQGGDSLP